MLSKAEVKYINSLQNKKYRKIERAFFVEGYKNVQELLNSDYEVLSLYITSEFEHEFKSPENSKEINVKLISIAELTTIGTLETNTSAIAVVRIKDEQEFSINNEMVLALDGINDPGNLGTIIRTADWYGIKKIVCSPDTVDFYNPKVINATKGSFTRVKMFYKELSTMFKEYSIIPVAAAFMQGASIYDIRPSLPLILLLGNEANGIRTELSPFVTQKITIPKKGMAESLNVGVAAGILMDRLLN